LNGLSPAFEWTIFLALSCVAIGGAFRMTRTMSMVRSGIFLMGGFSALAGLFLLLSADLLASMQLMMYIGGMLVMILFMVKMSMDPGGAMMGIAPPEQESTPDGYYCPMHPEVRSKSEGKCPRCGMSLQPAPKQGQQRDSNRGDMHNIKQGDQAEAANEDHQNGGMQRDQMNQQDMQGGDMSNMDMAMTHEFTKPAAMAGILISVVLLLLIFSVRWPDEVPMHPDNAALIVGKELLGRYMIAFEAGGLLILLGVVGATIFGGKE
jgi:NADH:ubiquinone oxidoreductase subunit 6 (subunit J)